MAQRRMFSKTITENDDFLNMSLSTQALYFHLGIQADDDGFVSPNRIMRMIGAMIDDLNVLIAKKFVIPFENGVVVIRHWKINNYIQSDRKKDTVFLKELAKLSEDNNGVYKMDTKCIENVRLGKDSIEKNILSSNDDAKQQNNNSVKTRSEAQQVVDYWIEKWEKTFNTKRLSVKWDIYVKNTNPIVKQLGVDRMKQLLDLWFIDDEWGKKCKWEYGAFIEGSNINKLNTQL